MTILRVAKMGHPCLRRQAMEISHEDIGSPRVQRLIDDMVDTMVDYQGIGLAAPQVFQSLRLIVVGDPDHEPVEESAFGNQDGPEEEVCDSIPLTIVVNPQVTGHSADLVENWEGCLSIPDMHGLVPRFREIGISGFDRHGNPLQVQQADVFSRVLQHELDHLDGILYLDRMTDLTSLCFAVEYNRYHRT